MLPDLQFGTLVEVGAGDGAQAEAFAEHFAEVHAIDANASLEWTATKPIRHIGTVPGEFDIQADFLFCSNVLEHIQPDSLPEFLSCCRGMLKPGGAAWFAWSPVWSPIGQHIHNRAYTWNHLRSPDEWELFLSEQFGDDFRDKWLNQEWRPGLLRRDWLRMGEDHLRIEEVMRGMAEAGFEIVAHNTQTKRTTEFLSLPNADELLQRASLLDITCEADTYLNKIDH